LAVTALGRSEPIGRSHRFGRRRYLIRADVAGLRDELAIEAGAHAGRAAQFPAMPNDDGTARIAPAKAIFCPLQTFAVTSLQ
jgi:hypothetical protein